MKIALLRCARRQTGPAAPGPSDGGDPNDAKLELGRGVLEALGRAPDAAGLTVSGEKFENTKLSAVPAETTS
jgi:hypothetical protein